MRWPRFDIHHPALQDEPPAGFWRWLKYHIGDWLECKGRRLVDRALHPDRDDDIPF